MSFRTEMSVHVYNSATACDACLCFAVSVTTSTASAGNYHHRFGAFAVLYSLVLTQHTVLDISLIRPPGVNVNVKCQCQSNIYMVPIIEGRI